MEQQQGPGEELHELLVGLEEGLHSEALMERLTGEGVSFTKYNVTFVASPGRSKPQSIESAGSLSPGSQ